MSARPAASASPPPEPSSSDESSSRTGEPLLAPSVTRRLVERYVGGPAAEAGLKRGDAILAVDGQNVDNPDAFGYRFTLKGTQGQTSLTVLRDSKQMDLRVTLLPPPERPARDPVRSLIYAAGDRAVRHVYVDGEQVVRDAKVLSMDYPAAAAALDEAQRRVLERTPALDWAKRPAEQISPLTFRVA